MRSIVPRGIPKWMMYYDRVAYGVLLMDVIFPLGYLGYVFVVMNDRNMYLPFEYARSWLELNSYSLIPPFFAVPVAPMLTWQVKNRIKLSDGDFYGIIGTMLGIGSISIYDSTRCVSIYIVMNSPIEPGNKAEALKSAFFKGVSGTIYQNWQYILKGSGGIVFSYEHLKDGYRVERADGSFDFLLHPDNRTAPVGGVWIEPIISDRGIRLWTHDIQLNFHCCGATSYKDWEHFQGDIYSEVHRVTNVTSGQEDFTIKYGGIPPSCYCSYSCQYDQFDHESCFETNGCKSNSDPSSMAEYKSRPGCHYIYFQFLTQQFLVLAILQLIMGLLYICTLFVSIFNFAAVRQIETKFVEESDAYSLLRDSSTSLFHDFNEHGESIFIRKSKNERDRRPGPSRPQIIQESRHILKMKRNIDPNYKKGSHPSAASIKEYRNKMSRMSGHSHSFDSNRTKLTPTPRTQEVKQNMLVQLFTNEKKAGATKSPVPVSHTTDPFRGSLNVRKGITSKTNKPEGLQLSVSISDAHSHGADLHLSSNQKGILGRFEAVSQSHDSTNKSNKSVHSSKKSVVPKIKPSNAAHGSNTKKSTSLPHIPPKKLL